MDVVRGRSRALVTLALALAATAACGIDAVGEWPGSAFDAAGDASARRADEGGHADGSDPSAPPDGAAADASDDAKDDVDLTDVDAGPISAGSALRFDGNDWVNVGALAIPTDFTVEAWVNPHSASNETDIVAEDRQNQAAAQFRLGLENGGRLFFIMSDSAGDTHGLFGSGYALRSAAALPTDTWTHVAVTKSGASFTLYAGASSTTFTADAAFAYGGPAVSFRIGGRVAPNGTGLDGGFDGIVDDVRLWNVARSSADIAASSAVPPPVVTPGLVAYFRFDEGSGTTTSDAKGGLVATFGGAPTWVTSTAF